MIVANRSTEKLDLHGEVTGYEHWVRLRIPKDKIYFGDFHTHAKVSDFEPSAEDLISTELVGIIGCIWTLY